MNAPFAWPTKYPLPQFRFKRIVIPGLAFLVVACSENFTAPDKTTAASSPGSPPAAADIIVMERTTTDAAGDGQVAVVHKSRKVLTPQMRVAGPALAARASTSAPLVAFDELPLPPHSLPARRESAMCSELPTWTERSKDANGRDVVMTGLGDAPASSIKVAQADGSTWTIERNWTRTATSWQLDRQVTTGARGYRDVVTYDHTTPKGKSVRNVIPSTTCSAHPRLTGIPSSRDSRSFYAPHAGELSAVLFPGSRVSTDSCDAGPDDDCYSKQIAVYKADIALVVAATGVAVMCSPPAVVTAIPCIVATTAYLAAVGNLKLEQMAYQHCLEQAAKPTPESLVTPGATSMQEASVLGATSGVRHSRSSFGGTTLNDCGGTAADTCHWDVWEISYDGGNTWEYYDTFLVCDGAM